MEIIRRYAILNLENIKFEIASNPEKKLSLSQKKMKKIRKYRKIFLSRTMKNLDIALSAKCLIKKGVNQQQQKQKYDMVNSLSNFMYFDFADLEE